MFVGREEQLEQLKALWRKPVASLVTCRGRRRIGKSTLIEEFARRNRVRLIKVEGVEPQPGVNNQTQQFLHLKRRLEKARLLSGSLQLGLLLIELFQRTNLIPKPFLLLAGRGGFVLLVRFRSGKGLGILMC